MWIVECHEYDTWLHGAFEAGRIPVLRAASKPPRGGARCGRDDLPLRGGHPTHGARSPSGTRAGGEPRSPRARLRLSIYYISLMLLFIYLDYI